jgi:hypothetical protein
LGNELGDRFFAGTQVNLTHITLDSWSATYQLIRCPINIELKNEPSLKMRGRGGERVSFFCCGSSLMMSLCLLLSFNRYDVVVLTS